MPKLTLDRLELRGKRVFVRADLNAPLDHDTVSDDTRLRAVVPTLQYVLDAGAAVVLASHLGRPKGQVAPAYSLRPVAERLEALLGRRVELAPDCVGPATRERAQQLGPGEVLLLENLRFHPEEEANDEGFAKALAALADCYVDDAFAAAHRAHASIEAITRHLQPAAAGLLMQQELAALGRILQAPERPLVALLGGAKVSDKLALVEHLLERVDALLIGGGMAFTFLRALGHDVGRSLVEPARIETARRALEAARRRGVSLVLPVDAVVADGLDSPAGRVVGVREIPATQAGLDIGPRTVERFTEALRGARTIVWNGPMGVFERPPFAAGTLAVAKAVAASAAFSVVGGGDTIAAVTQAGVGDRIGYISTAGGAFLEFLEGRALPGVEALTEAG
ncbi:MAG: phosphoglycerate kinase [Candidatus Rokubacteria bacterium RIFCSPHIGHO2_12_FULL_73_22]|nr:MAG: phosphoglycerate kinase [Candidatus Rokubacteria bacterium RIFCSPHIGHO2_12_FULL_73_22]OGK99780.1 MAG: phosphoglycerate kinase [Candidatus Rokubacteria bacterium RIFCSPHIGHO2_02_FULL_73_26]OGL10707.1 MAG: phosphoglycerate kinase [Candidatus Rokubacteria bacterium RIFCSPLOWO2_02_FULL_73_56]OGL26549.1 MAG: phosphoglycerate kinase [Candidatus Rokubacteria bacterium RIFCSPLOWO2_12_FULL_73_47]